jgi:hypothetical protein
MARWNYRGERPSAASSSENEIPILNYPQNTSMGKIDFPISLVLLALSVVF